MPTKYHLKNSNDDHDVYSFNFTFLHNYDVFLAENYTVEVVLPFGATDIKLDLPFDGITTHSELEFSTLDFFGKPKLVIKKKNATSVLHEKNFQVTYRFEQKYMLVKPLALSITIFGFYFMAIIS